MVKGEEVRDSSSLLSRFALCTFPYAHLESHS